MQLTASWLAECARRTHGVLPRHPWPSVLQLAGRVLSEEEAAACALRWQNECAMFAAELAVMHSCSPVHSDGGSGQQEGGDAEQAMDMERPAGASKSHDSAGSRKRKFGGGDDGSESDGASQGALGGLAAAPGYVEVCGLELPQRRQQDGGGAGAAGAGPPLVHTPAVDRNLEALALGEQGRGQPGLGHANARLRLWARRLRHPIQGMAGCWRAQNCPPGLALPQACAWAAPSCWRAHRAAASRR